MGLGVSRYRYSWGRWGGSGGFDVDVGGGRGLDGVSRISSSLEMLVEVRTSRGTEIRAVIGMLHASCHDHGG